MNHDLIVDEEYIRTESGNICSSLCSLDLALTYYIAILETVLKQGVKSGATASALRAYIECARGFKGDMKTAGKNVSKLMKNYLIAIDDADQYLF